MSRDRDRKPLPCCIVRHQPSDDARDVRLGQRRKRARQRQAVHPRAGNSRAYRGGAQFRQKRHQTMRRQCRFGKNVAPWQHASPQEITELIKAGVARSNRDIRRAALCIGPPHHSGRHKRISLVESVRLRTIRRRGERRRQPVGRNAAHLSDLVQNARE